MDGDEVNEWWEEMHPKEKAVSTDPRILGAPSIAPS